MVKSTSPYLFAAAVASVIAVAAPGAALAEFPNQPVRLIVGFSPGGNTDLTARMIAPYMQEQLGVPVIVENRVGAQGRVGADAVAKAEPDGYTLLVTTETSIVTAAYAGEPLPYDPQADFAPVSLVVQGYDVIVAHPDFEADTFADLIRIARERPGELDYAHTGVGGGQHLIFEIVQHAVDMEIRGISYGTGTGALLPGLLNGEIQLTLGSVTPFLPQIEDGAVKALAVTSPERLAALPDVPTVAEEADMPGFSLDLKINGVLAPAGTPDDILHKLADAVRFAVESEEMQARFRAAGEVGVGSTPEEFRTYLDQAHERMANEFAPLLRGE